MKFEVLLLFQRFSAVLACPWATPLHGYKKRCAICGSFWRKDLTGTISIPQSTGIPQGGSWFPLALNLRDSHMDALKDSAGFRSRLRLEGLDHVGSCWITLQGSCGKWFACPKATILAMEDESWVGLNLRPSLSG